MIDISNSALVLIEFQKEWIEPDGKIHFLMKDNMDEFHTAIKNGKKALEEARKRGLQVIHCGLSFQAGHPELGTGGYGLRAAIPKVGSFLAQNKGSEFADSFYPNGNEFVVKGRVGASGFAGSNLDTYLRNQQITDLFLAGFALHVCVESTMRHGHDLGYRVTVLEDACAAFNNSQKKHVLEDVVHHYAKKIKVEDFTRMLSSEPHTL